MAQVVCTNLAEDGDVAACKSGSLKPDATMAAEGMECLSSVVKVDQKAAGAVELETSGESTSVSNSAAGSWNVEHRVAVTSDSVSSGGASGVVLGAGRVAGTVSGVLSASSVSSHKSMRPPLVPTSSRTFSQRSGSGASAHRLGDSPPAQQRSQEHHFAAVSRDVSAAVASCEGDTGRQGGDWKIDSGSRCNSSVEYWQNQAEQLMKQYVRVCAENEALRQQAKIWAGSNGKGESVLSDPPYQDRQGNQCRDVVGRESTLRTGGDDWTSYVRRSELLLDLALKGVPLIIAHSDQDLRYTYIRFLHYPSSNICSEAILRKHDSELVGIIPGAREIGDLKQEVIQLGVAQRRELIIDVPNGSPRCLVLICDPTFDSAGVVVGVTSLSMDVTDQVTVKDRLAQMGQKVASHEAAEKELRVAIARADEAMEAKNNFLAVMSHEIRTPLNGVLGMAQVLATTKLDDEQKELVDAMVFSGDVLMAIISDILDLSKVEAGTMELEERELSPRDIVKHVVRTTIAVTRDRGIQIVADVSQDIPPLVIGDPLRIKQVITNLVFNAVKFTKKGHVVVRMRPAKQNGEPYGETDVRTSVQSPAPTVEQVSTGSEVDFTAECDSPDATGKLDATWDPLLESGRRDIATEDDEDSVLELSLAYRNQSGGVIESNAGHDVFKEAGNFDQEPTSREGLEAFEEKIIWLQCEIEDTGIGIPKESFPTLFEKFTQVHSSTTRKYGGTGLGLAICKRLVELMGGRIYVTSEVGVGSKFTFTIRCKHPSAISGVSRTMSVSETRLKTNLSHTTARVHKLRAGMSIPSPPHRTFAASPPVRDGDADGQGTPSFPAVSTSSAEQREEVLNFGAPPVGREQPRKGSNLHERHGSWAGNEERSPPVNLSTQSSSAIFSDNCLVRAAEGKSLGLRRTSSGPSRIECSLMTALEESKQVQILTNAVSGEKKTPRLLLAEDNKVNVMVAQSMLKRLGLLADVAYNGLEAIQALKRNHYDLVLMDICMPVMDGLEVTRCIRRYEQTGRWDEEFPTAHGAVSCDSGLTPEVSSPTIGSTRVSGMSDLTVKKRLPIVAMTANALSNCEDECSANGMDSFMTKPVTFKKLKDVLDTFLLKNTSSLPTWTAHSEKVRESDS